MKIPGFSKKNQRIYGLEKTIETWKKGFDSSNYRDMRIEFNLQVFQLLLGCEIQISENGKWKISHDDSLLDREEILKVFEMVEDFIETVERQYIMVKKENFKYQNMYVAPYTEGITGKDLRKEISRISGCMLRLHDFVRLAHLGELTKSKVYRRRMMIVGGCIGAVLLAYLSYKGYKSYQEYQERKAYEEGLESPTYCLR